MKDAAIRTANLSATKQEILRRRLQGESVGQTYKLEPIIEDVEHRFEPFPLTDMVEAQWMGRNRAYDLGNQAAHVYAEFFDGDFDLKRFEDAWNRLLVRHEMLRAYVRPDGQYQINREVPRYEIQVFDLRGKSEEEVKEHLFNTRRRMTRHVARADIWPLFEIVVSRVSDDWMRLHLSCDLLISDIKSFQIMGKELATLYKDPTAKLSPDPLEVSYRDYVLALHRLKKGPMYERARKYWLEERLPVLPPSPALPMRKTPTNVDIPYFVHRAFSVDPKRWRQIQALAKKYDLTPDTAVLAAFVEVFATWNRMLSFTLNVLSFQRIPLHLQINEIVGNFGATVLLAVHNEDGETFVDRAHKVREQLVKDLDHWVFSGVAVLREINRLQGGSLGATMPVVFASTLNFSSGKDPSLLGEVETSFYAQHMKYIQLQTPQVWFDHQVSEDNGALVLEWDVVEDLFPPGLIDDMWRAYQGIFDRLAAGDEAWLEKSRALLLPPEQLAQRATVNATEAPIPSVLLHELFAQQAQRQPDHVAIIGPGIELTYGQLDRMSNQLAHKLRSAGAAPGTLVAVVMEPGWQQAVAVLGILKSGAAYLPIDAAVPAERLAYLLDNGKVAIALTQSHLDDRLSWPSSVQHLVVSSDALSGEPDTALKSVQAQTDLAYVIYTSGSTGQPKGVMIDHRGAVNTIVDINQRYNVGPDDRILALSSLSFDLSVYDVFGVLAAGGAIVVPPAAEVREPSTWGRLIHEHRITLWNTVPALMEMQIDYLGRHQQRLPDSLRVVLLSGDWIPVRLPDRIRAMARPDVQLISLGGATEASIWSILYPIGEVNPEWKSIPYGKPMLNQRFHVLNEAMDPCPVWVPGQLYIAGEGLAKGYWQDPEKTAESFITHPTTGERLYRTGDLGRYLPDGNIEFLGRADLQVKVLGHRIELGEIEAVLQEHPKVQSVAVVAVGDTSETRRLVAYIVPQGGAPTQEELTTLAQSKLPEYMVPAQVFFLDAMPLSFTGKVDRKALADQRVETHRVYTAPQTPLEKQLTAIWAGVLNTERVGIHDSFFELGGNSLLITHLVARIHEEFGVEMPLRTLYEQPTVAGFIPVFEEMRAGASAAAAPARVDLAAEAVLDPTIGG